MILRVLLFLFSISVRSQSLETFSNPNYPFPGGTLVWPLGSVQTIAWETALTSYNITIWQQHYAPNSAKYAQTPLVGEEITIPCCSDWFADRNRSIQWQWGRKENTIMACTNVRFELGRFASLSTLDELDDRIAFRVHLCLF